MASFDRSGLADALPFACALARQRFETVGVIVEAKGTEARLQPGLKALLHARDKRQHGLAPEGAIGFSIIAKRIVAGQTQQQRRHAEGKRDLVRGACLRLGKIHVLWRKRQRFPVEPAFEQQRPSGVGRAALRKREA